MTTTRRTRARGAGGRAADLLGVVFANRLNLLLLLVPVSWAVGILRPGSPWLFITAAGSVLPLAALIGEATNSIASRTGPTLGGFVNATFGNAAELIIGIVALHAGRVDLVKASISGAIIGNLLGVLGVSMFVGGLGRDSQHFNRRTAGHATIMLFLAVVALVMPAVFDLTVYGSLTERPATLYRFGFLTSILLIIAYGGSLVYTFTRQRDLFHSQQPGQPAAKSPVNALILLAIVTVVTTVEAELLVAGLDPVFSAFGITELFSGVIVVALVGGAAESYAAVRAAWNDRMTLATEIAIGSSAQIALLVAPVLVLVSFAFGHPMTLLFHPLEIAGIGLSVLAIAIVALDGESTWVEGLQLLAVYAVLGIAFYLMPPQR